MVDLDEIRKRAQSATDYAHGLTDKWKDVQLEKYSNYRMDPDVVKELKELYEGQVVISIGASWCKDCREAIPVFMRLEEEIGLEVLVLSGVKTAPLNPDKQWAVPPSPPEVDEWGVTAIPWIVIFRKDGERVGTIIEKQELTPTLEGEILHLIKRSKVARN
jgi:thiol-disulfide isomerase/thioredoxin